ncbi:MAG: hypothetical protein M3O82_01875 [Verrucomicrobiota bacterium]|nr:hypothetical protein [Verrucomicrobiota bacterium]
MIEPKILPAVSREVHDRLVAEARVHDARGETACRLLTVISRRPPTERIKVFPGSSFSEIEVATN